MICLTLTAGTIEENCKLVQENRDWIDIAELRLDLLDPSEIEKARTFPEKVDVPLILTVRTVQEGGAYEGDEETRLDIMARLLSYGFRYVDIDHSCKSPELEETADKAEVRIIRSMHLFDRMPQSPEEIEDIFSYLKNTPRDIPKLALYPKTIKDLTTIFSVPSTGERILLGMGDAGFPSRVLYRKTGSIITYTSAPGYCAAPGHAHPDDFDLQYRVTDINKETRLFGIIGDPVLHSASPDFHNKGFAFNGLNTIYVPFTVPKGENELRDFFCLADKLDIKGLSITIPHKEAVIYYLDEVDSVVKKTGACNTIIKTAKGWQGFNTDYEGFLRPLVNRKLIGPDSPGVYKKAAVVGAGGAARAVVHALRDQGWHVLICNRTKDKAIALAEQTGAESAGLEDMDLLEKCDIIIQTTSVGLNEEKSPIPEYSFKPEQVAYDLIYTPEKTLFLQQAQKSGCTIISGKEMFIAQACLQYQYFTGGLYPLEAQKANLSTS